MSAAKPNDKSGAKPREKSAANMAETVSLTLNERILKECHGLYIDQDNGLIRIAESVGINLLAPRRKINVLVIGNHSAGKSSFINWYVEEHIQKTGVAIETQGFTFVTSGRKRESLTGNATLHLYPHFEPLRQIEGIVDYLYTEISTSKQKKFSLITFVDTPGLVDGEMKYPFNVNQAILWLGNLADLIFVFFDPMGQALCKRTLNLVERLSERHAERMRFYLSKADEAGNEADRQRVMMQIVQDLCKRPVLNKVGFDMPTIYVPNPNKPSRCLNQIEEVCKDIEKTINHTVQNTLNTLERDCEQVATVLDQRLSRDRADCAYNLKARVRGSMFYLLGLMLPLVMAIYSIVFSVSSDLLRSLLGQSIADTVQLYLEPLRRIWQMIPSSLHFYIIIFLLISTLMLLLAGRIAARSRITLSRKQRREYMDNYRHVTEVIINRKQTLYQEYLKQSVAEADL